VIPCLATAQSILAIESVSLQDSGYTPHEVVDILAAEDHRAYIAYKGSQAVGFCSCFITFWVDGAQLEIDMLGVIPEHRGRGIATAMVRRALADARKEGISHARAVVEVENRASQGVFRRLGFAIENRQRSTSDAPCDVVQMLVYDLFHAASRTGAELPHGWRVKQQIQGPGADVWILWDEQGRQLAEAETRQVQTLSYTGLWVEALWADTPTALRAMTNLLIDEAARRRLDEVGYLAASLVSSDDDIGVGANAPWVGWIRVGRYQIWSKHLDIKE
jgi:ribosomal protein S18 acetylase RimI-like enzyme